MTYKCISIQKAHTLIQTKNVTLIDIRDSNSYMKKNIKGSINISNDNIHDVIATADKNKPLIIYCYHGNSSKNAAEYFYNEGFQESYSMDGGFEEWRLTYPSEEI